MAGWAAPNDVLDPRGRLAMCIQNCCGSHLPLGLLAVWDNIVTRDENGLAVNLLMNRPGKTCDVLDWQPYEGRAEIHLKADTSLRVRVTPWAPREEVRVSVKSKRRECNWDARREYVQVGAVSDKDVVEVTYPLREWSNEELLGGTRYTTHWRGDTVIAIEPRGLFIPIFERYREVL